MFHVCDELQCNRNVMCLLGCRWCNYNIVCGNQLVFFQQNFLIHRKKYSTYNREIAIYLSIEYCKHMLEGRAFTIFTDHKPLTYAFQQKPDKASPIQARHLHHISQFSTDIQHISKKNIVADVLSRLDTIEFPQVIEFQVLAEHQASDPKLHTLLSKSDTVSLKFSKIIMPKTNNSIFCDISNDRIRPYFPITTM